MKTILKTIAALAIIMLFFTSCNRDDNSGTNNPTTSTGGFTWRENDPNSTTIKTAGSSEVRTQYKSIFAFSGTTSGTLFEINLTSVSVGTYDLAASGNSFYYSGFGTSGAGATSGEVVITKNDGKTASGTFKAFRTGTDPVTRVYGTFTDIPVK